jgi:hypothetical protein
VPPAKKKSASSGSAARLTKIEAYLGRLYRFLNRYSWGPSVQRKKRKKKGNGGEQTGSNPPKWPP